MNYAAEIVGIALFSGAAWELANHVHFAITKVFLRSLSFMLAALTLGFLMLQYVALLKP
jgi:hypothetical protein